MRKMVSLAIVAGLFAGSVPLAFGLDEGLLQKPRGGQPSMGSKPSVENFAEQVAYQRAF